MFYFYSFVNISKGKLRSTSSYIEKWARFELFTTNFMVDLVGWDEIPKMAATSQNTFPFRKQIYAEKLGVSYL